MASGGNESEIFIWDMNNFGSPMTPGPKTQVRAFPSVNLYHICDGSDFSALDLKPLEDISCVAWNRQVQHILASASPSGRASVWDLRKNDLIIKVSDHSNRVRLATLRFPAALQPASHPRLCYRCIAPAWPGTRRWRRSWFWPRRTTGCPSSRCGIYASPPLL